MSHPLRLYNTRALPRVSCPTCNEPNASWFPDGSPSYSCSHPTKVGPTPYYADDLVTLYHADYREIVPWISSKVDVLVLDPPFDEWSKVATILPAETVVAFTSWQHRPAVHDLYGQPRAELVWTFADGRWVSHGLPRITHETILVFGRTGSAYVGPLTDGLSVRKGTGSIGRDKMGPRTYTPHERKSIDSVQVFPRDVAGPLGVWSKPLGLVSRLLEWVAPPQAVILDPFVGSGTTLVAAKSLGMTSIGIEIDERHCEIAADRCRQEVLGL